MDEANRAPGAGDVILQLGEEVITLRPTPEAAIRLCRRPGGLASTIAGKETCFSRVASCDIDEMCEVIRAGVGVGPNTDRNLPEKIFRAGLFDVRTALTIFLGTIGNGGNPVVVQPVNDEDREKEAAEGEIPLGKAGGQSSVTG